MILSLPISITVFSLVTQSLAAGTHGRSLPLMHRHASVQRRASHVPGTNYDVTTNESACGNRPDPSEHVVAMNTAGFNNGAACGKTITIKYGNKQTTATVIDLCPTCGEGGIDMSNGLFEFFAPLSVGELWLDWSFGNDIAPPPKPKPTSTWSSSSTSTWSSTSTTTHHTTTSKSTTTSNASSAKATSTSATPTPYPTQNSNIAQLYQAIISFGELVVSGAAPNA